MKVIGIIPQGEKMALFLKEEIRRNLENAQRPSLTR